MKKKPLVSIKRNINFGKYQKTKTKLKMVRANLSTHDFNNTPQYKRVLLKELDETIDRLNMLREELK